MQNSKIEWTGFTWNPTTGCNKVSQGCKNCYAEIMHKRLMKMQPQKYCLPFLDGAFEYPEALRYPLQVKRSSTVFVNSMSDIFHENISWNYLYKIFEIMYLANWHTFQVLTKREERLHLLHDVYFHLKRNYPDGDFPLKNVHLGVSVEDQTAADKRIPLLLKAPAAVRFLSCEPLLGPVDITNKGLRNAYSVPTDYYTEPHTGKTIGIEWTDPGDDFIGIDWVICGGESGRKARPMHPDWARSLRDQCKNANVAFFFKQWGDWLPSSFTNPYFKVPIGHFNYNLFIDGETVNEETYGHHNQNMYKVGKKAAGRLLDGREWNEFPDLKTVQQ